MYIVLYTDAKIIGIIVKINSLTTCYSDEMHMAKFWGLHSSRYCIGLSGPGVEECLQVKSEAFQNAVPHNGI